MITEKQEAIEEVKKKDINFENISPELLKDKDVALSYIQAHSSNKILLKGFPIDIDAPHMICDKNFIIQIINNLEVGYSKETLANLIKYSTNLLVRNHVEKHKDITAEELKCVAEEILNEYKGVIKKRAEELAHKQSILDEVDKYIESAEIDGESDKHSCENGIRYKRTDIGFTAKF